MSALQILREMIIFASRQVSGVRATAMCRQTAKHWASAFLSY